MRIIQYPNLYMNQICIFLLYVVSFLDDPSLRWKYFINDYRVNLLLNLFSSTKEGTVTIDLSNVRRKGGGAPASEHVGNSFIEKMI